MGAIPVVEALTTDPNPNPIPQDCLAMGAIPVFFHETQLAIWPDAAGSWLRDAVIFIDQKDVQAPYHLTILPSYHPTILPSYRVAVAYRVPGGGRAHALNAENCLAPPTRLAARRAALGRQRMRCGGHQYRCGRPCGVRGRG